MTRHMARRIATRTTEEETAIAVKAPSLSPLALATFAEVAGEDILCKVFVMSSSSRRRLGDLRFAWWQETDRRATARSTYAPGSFRYYVVATQKISLTNSELA